MTRIKHITKWVYLYGFDESEISAVKYDLEHRDDHQISYRCCLNRNKADMIVYKTKEMNGFTKQQVRYGELQQ